METQIEEEREEREEKEEREEREEKETPKFKKNNPNKMRKKYKKYKEVLDSFCYISKKNNIVFECCEYPKVNEFLSKEDIFEYIIIVLQKVLEKYETLLVHINVNELKMLDVLQNKDFIIQMKDRFYTLFDDTLEKMYIYESSFFFTKIYSFISLFLEQKTLDKIVWK
jgi:hypothetical protein